MHIELCKVPQVAPTLQPGTRVFLYVRSGCKACRDEDAALAAAHGATARKRNQRRVRDFSNRG